MANYRKWTYVAGMAFSMLIMPEITLADAAGTCGENVKWSFTSSNNTLVVKGNGKMIRQDSLVSLGATKVEVEDGVREIGDAAFAGFDKMETLKLPASVWSLEGDALSKCSNLKNVTIPKQLISVAKEKILSNPNVERLAVVDNSLTWIFSVKNGDLTIYGKGVLENLIYTKKANGAEQTCFFPAEMGIKTLTIDNGVSGIEEQVFNGCTTLEKAVLPTGMMEIGNSVFAGCTNLKTVALPKNLTTLGNAVFAGCTSLQSISLPESLTAMGEGIFSNCASMTQANIPTSITTLPKRTFMGCSSLAGINIPDNITLIEPYAFAFCSSMREFTVDPKNEVYAAKNGVLFYKDMKTLVKYPEGKADAAYVIPAGVKEMDASALIGAKFKTITIPAAMEVVPAGAFRSCANLESIQVGGGKFYSSTDGVLMSKDKKELIQYPMNKKNSSYAIPKTVQTIGAFAFSDCNNLGTIKIPASVNSIEERAFNKCEFLTEIQVDAANVNFTSVNNVLMSKDYSRLVLYSPRKTDVSYAIPAGVVIVDAYSFYKCDNLKSLTIPATATDVSGRAFVRLNLSSLDMTGKGKITIKSNDASKGSVSLTCLPEAFDEFLSEKKNTPSSLELFLTAVPNQGYSFEKWNNGSENPRLKQTLKGNIDVVANFK
ncbi:MAG: leucine-rich repeat domain-containing protein [Paludibacteraceae bacterium]|nr:leucine-rich repeat domain-containing protein [Paludibacteraceae bacterium]